jgi:hypothetical protein
VLTLGRQTENFSERKTDRQTETEREKEREKNKIHFNVSLYTNDTKLYFKSITRKQKVQF